jgi:hypothetical protein
MKRITVVTCAVIMFAAFGVANAQDFVTELKAGTAYAKATKSFGFNSNIELGAGVNPYFELFAKPGFVWYKWDHGLGIQKQNGSVTTELKSTENDYCFPVLAGAKIRFANVKESTGVLPYVSIAAGYSWMHDSYKIPSYTDAATSTSVASISGSNSYKGFTWETLVGVGFLLPDTNMMIAAEVGYRGMKLKDSNSFTADMSGFVANLGVSFSFGGSDL